MTPDARKPRVALYSHDTVGLGHLRRNMLIARTLADSPIGANVLTIAGAVEARLFPTPRGVDCLTLPALCKEEEGHYGSRSLDMSLGELAMVRGQTIRGAVEAFEPDVLIVDKVPLGAAGELLPALELLRTRPSVSCVLGLRDVLDEPAAVRVEWEKDGYEAAIRDHYDAVWVYGDQRIYDPIQEYGLSDRVAAKMRFTGYFDRQVVAGPPDEAASALAKLPFRIATDQRLVLCLLGGGQDGAKLAESFADVRFGKDTVGVLVTGPFMPAPIQAMLASAAERNPRLHVINFLAEPTHLLDRADRVIAMGGYNTVSELLSYGKNALVVPRVRPRREQLIRAERLRELGLLDVCHPQALSSRAIEQWLATDDVRRVEARRFMHFDGVSTIVSLFNELRPTSSPRTQAAAR